MKNKAPSKPACERTEGDSTPTMVDFNLDDFTDYVAFHTKCDTIEHGDSVVDEKMSQKKCRFCD
jgi:hypothetical protein